MSNGPRQWPERPGMKDAIERVRYGRRVKPNESDAPSVSTFPARSTSPSRASFFSAKSRRSS